MNWRDFEAAAPELAALGRDRFERTNVLLYDVPLSGGWQGRWARNTSYSIAWRRPHRPRTGLRQAIAGHEGLPR